jgi:cation:H+ antiporter
MFELPLWQWVGIFALAGVVLVRAGIGLARAGDEIATRTGVGGLVVGVILVSMATSLPEIATDVSAAVAGAPDLAVGDLFGSSMANMAILAVVDLMRRRRVWQRVVLAQARAGSIAIALTALAVLGVATPEGFALGWVGADTALIFVAYVASVAWTRRSPDTARAVPAMAELPAPTGIGEAERPREPVRDAIRRFVLAAGVVLVTGPVVAVSARGISDTSGLGGTFVGVSLVAVSTSGPQRVNVRGDVRRRAVLGDGAAHYVGAATRRRLRRRSHPRTRS